MEQAANQLFPPPGNPARHQRGVRGAAGA
jgi:hypothetical protein